MSPSKAEQQIHYATLSKDDVGLNGIIWNEKPEHLDNDDVSRLIPEGMILPDDTAQRFCQAHNKGNVRELLRPPDTKVYDEALLWPFYLNKNSGHIHDDDLERKFWKGCRNTPGKARHAGWHMALYGRLHAELGDTMVILCRLMLVLRHIPSELKRITRLPIPKPEPGATRPLALLHDINAFLIAMVSEKLGQGLEATGAIPRETIAYRAGHGTDDITLAVMAIREDALESKTLTAIIEEDEEKFFDRVVLELQLLALIKCGCPPKGYVEFKADDLDRRPVDIITRSGTTQAWFETGIMQGSMLSVQVANPVTSLKFDAWRSGRRPRDCHPYDLSTHDPLDYDHRKLWAAGYCDDNSRWMKFQSPRKGNRQTLSGNPDAAVDPEGNRRNVDTREAQANELIKAQAQMATRTIQDSIDATGDLSMITKLGRKGAKTTVTISQGAGAHQDALPD